MWEIKNCSDEHRDFIGGVLFRDPTNQNMLVLQQGSYFGLSFLLNIFAAIIFLIGISVLGALYMEKYDFYFLGGFFTAMEKYNLYFLGGFFTAFGVLLFKAKLPAAEKEKKLTVNSATEFKEVDSQFNGVQSYFGIKFEDGSWLLLHGGNYVALKRLWVPEDPFNKTA